MDGWDISILTWNMNPWYWHLLTCSHVQDVKGPLSLNRHLWSHKYDIEAPTTISDTQNWKKTNTANLRISCIIKKKKSVRRTERRSFQSSTLLHTAGDRPMRALFLRVENVIFSPPEFLERGGCCCLACHVPGHSFSHYGEGLRNCFDSYTIRSESARIDVCGHCGHGNVPQ